MDVLKCENYEFCPQHVVSNSPYETSDENRWLFIVITKDFTVKTKSYYYLSCLVIHVLDNTEIPKWLWRALEK